jgi:hypothetical protein
LADAVISALRRLREENSKFRTHLFYVASSRPA